MASKVENFVEVLDGDKLQYECLICSRRISSKQNILQHLHNLHSLSPVKKQRKLYVDNEELAVPLRTLFRWKRVKDAAENSEQNQLLHNTNFASQGPESLEGAVDTTCTSQATSDTSSFRRMDCERVVDVPFDLSSGCPSESSDVGSLNSEYMSDVSNTEESTDTSSASDSTSDTDSTSDVESEYSSSSDTANPNSEDNTNLLSNELEALRIVSCFRRHNLTTSACRDITATVRSVCNDSKSAHVLNYDYLMSFVDTNLLSEVHYCELCSEVFPDDPDRTRCGSANCEGLRYKGPISKQNSKDRQPRKCFIIADMKKQLSDLLQSPGVMADIRTQKDAARSRKDDDTDSITDISDGAAYRKMLKDDGFLNNADYNITAVINTDGVNLYSSSKVELWPIFMAINELNPKARFSRSNVLLVGIWQGKGKPPFKQYVESLAPHLNDLYRGGVNIALNGDNINVKLKVVCGIFDLPAKAGILNMTYYNGQEACITCEEPGVTVKQGKGTARSYPDRNGQYTLRNHEDVLNCMQSGTDKKRVKGFKGVSGLASIESFDLVDGIMPDYMHGVLLGITSTLMSKWFSPTGSNKAYFIGKHLKEISRRLQNIRPPTSIERLPRDLEKNYKNLKATELQAWLLFYAVPCLVGILPEMYLAHFSCFSEAVYIHSPWRSNYPNKLAESRTPARPVLHIICRTVWGRKLWTKCAQHMCSFSPLRETMGTTLGMELLWF